MSSNAASEYYLARSRARLLIMAASSPPPATLLAQHKSACLHACWAMQVAAWEAYIERLIREVYQIIADPSNAKLSAVLALLNLITEVEIKRFNTPNAENSRNLLYRLLVTILLMIGNGQMQGCPAFKADNVSMKF